MTDERPLVADLVAHIRRAIALSLAGTPAEPESPLVLGAVIGALLANLVPYVQAAWPDATEHELAVLVWRELRRAMKPGSNVDGRRGRRDEA